MPTSLLVKPQPHSNVMEAFELGILAPAVSCTGEYYLVDFGEGVYPRRHQVFYLETLGLMCHCEYGSECPAAIHAQQYMLSVEMIGDASNADLALKDAPQDDAPKLATVHPDDFMLRFLPHVCPECGDRVMVDHRFNGTTPEGLPVAGWVCASGGATHFLMDKMHRTAHQILARRQANPDPWLVEPSRDGNYPGIRLSEFKPRTPIITDTTLWYQAAHATAHTAQKEGSICLTNRTYPLPCAPSWWNRLQTI